MGMLVVAFVGDPCGWSRVVYEPPAIPAKGCSWLSPETVLGVRTESATTLKPLITNGARGIVYVPVSVAFGMARNVKNVKRPRNPCCRGVDELSECSSDKLDNYDALEQCSRKRLEEFLSCELGDKAGKVEILVAPSVGRYQRGDRRAVSVFSGDTGLYYAYVLATLYEKMFLHKPDTLVIDTTHGINYATSMGLQAALRAAEAYSAASGQPLRVITVNSEPVQGDTGKDGAAIYVTMCHNIQPSTATRNLLSLQPPGKLYVRLVHGKEVLPRELEKKRREIVDAARKVYDIAKALVAGLPLLGLHLHGVLGGENQLALLKGAPRLLVESVAYSPITERENNVFKIMYRYTIEPIQAEALIAAHALHKVLERVLDGIPGRRVGEAVFYPLEELDNLVERLNKEGLLTTQSFFIAKNEVSDIKVRLRLYDHIIGIGDDKPVPYTKIYAVADGNLRAAFQREETHSCSINERIFYAHAGLVKELIYIVKHGGKYAVAYKPQCLKEIENKIVRKLSQ